MQITTLCWSTPPNHTATDPSNRGEAGWRLPPDGGHAAWRPTQDKAMPFYKDHIYPHRGTCWEIQA
jgi:hypothetical protein